MLCENGYRHRRKEKFLEYRTQSLEKELATAHTLVDYQDPVDDMETLGKVPEVKEIRSLEQHLPTFDENYDRRRIIGNVGFFERLRRKWDGWESKDDPGYRYIAEIALQNNIFAIKDVRIATLSKDKETRKLAEEMVLLYARDENFISTWPHQIGSIKLPGYSPLQDAKNRLSSLETLCENGSADCILNLEWLYTIARYDSSSSVKELAEDMAQSYEKERDFSHTKPFIRKVIDDYATTLFSVPITKFDAHTYVVARDRYKIYVVDRNLAPADTYANYQASAHDHESARFAFASTFPENPVYLRTIERQREIQEGAEEVGRAYAQGFTRRLIRMVWGEAPYGHMAKSKRQRPEEPAQVDYVESKIISRKVKE